MQVPRRPGSLQETHCPWQAELQQTPSAQKPEKQSVVGHACGAWQALSAAPGRVAGVRVALAVGGALVVAGALADVARERRAKDGRSRQAVALAVADARAHDRGPLAGPGAARGPASRQSGSSRTPSQVPSSPQGFDDDTLQSAAWRGASPFARPTQTPSEPLWAQVLHPELQASLQQ